MKTCVRWISSWTAAGGLAATIVIALGSVTFADDRSDSSWTSSDTAAMTNRPITVDSSAAFLEAVSHARPGDRIVLAAGEYLLDKELTIRTQASQRAPLVIRAEIPGKAVLKGADTLHLRGARWVVVEGLVFAHRWLPRKRWLRLDECENIRITRCKFSMDETGATEKDKYQSVGIERSTCVRVDHCEFGPRTTRSMGDYVSTHLGSRYLRIDHNYFAHRANIGQNGGESVMIHGAGVWSHYAVIDHNLFERCNGEGEMIGLKSSRNTVRDNTLVSCEGAISIRDGSYNKVYGNIILNLLSKGEKTAPRVAGVRIFGAHNEVINNYFYRLAVPLEACWGDSDPPHEDNGTAREDRVLAYIAGRDNLVAHNTFIECGCLFSVFKKGIDVAEALARIEKAGGLLRANLDTYRANTSGQFITPHIPPQRWCFLNNMVYRTPASGQVRVFREAKPPYQEKDFRYLGNVLYPADAHSHPASNGPSSELPWTAMDPKLAWRGEGVYELASDSPLRHAAQHDDPGLEHWMFDGETKAQLEQSPNVGANLLVKPLTRDDVGILSP